MKGGPALSLETQFAVFLLSIVIGTGAAFLFDFYRVARLSLRLGRWGTGVGDLLAWMVLTVVVFGLLLPANWGEVRWYVLLGLGAGALLYHRSLSRFGAACWERFIRFADRLIRVLASPFLFAWRTAVAVFRIAARSLDGIRVRLRRRLPPPPEDQQL